MTERAPLEALRARLADGCAAVGIAGLGYVGLPDHTMLDYEWVVAHARLVLDTRNATRDVRQGRTKVVRL